MGSRAARGQDWEAEGSECQHREGQITGGGAGPPAGQVWGKGSAIISPVGGEAREFPLHSCHGLRGHRLVQLGSNPTAGNEQSQLPLSWHTLAPMASGDPCAQPRPGLAILSTSDPKKIAIFSLQEATWASLHQWVQV